MFCCSDLFHLNNGQFLFHRLGKIKWRADVIGDTTAFCLRLELLYPGVLIFLLAQINSVKALVLDIILNGPRLMRVALPIIFPLSLCTF